MSAAVSGVPAEAIEAAARAVYNLSRLAGTYDRWSIANPGVQESYREDARAALTAALPSLREQIAAEVLAPARALVDADETKSFVRKADLAATLSAPVQAAEPRNPHLPEKPADGQHVYSRGPSDIGGNRRCLLCGAYRGSVESERTCEGEWTESGKMRAWADEKWKQERAVQAAHVASGPAPDLGVRDDAATSVQAGEPTCTCGAAEYGDMVQHLVPCPLAPVQEPAPDAVVTVRMLHRTPNHAKGQLGTLHDASPSGHVNEYVKWVDYGEPIQWSHGQSESTGEWCGPGEYEIVPAAEEVGGE